MSETECVGEHIVPFLVAEPDKVQTLVDFVARVANAWAPDQLHSLHVEAKELFQELEQETRDELIEASQDNLHR